MGPSRMIVWCIAFGGVLVACSSPDHPAALPVELPAATLEWLEPDIQWGATVRPGVAYRFVQAPRGPWGVHLLRVELERCELGFAVLPADRAPAGRTMNGRAKVTDLARTDGSGIVAAVNGDFFSPEGRPLGIEVTRGEVLSRSNRSAFAWKPGGEPWFGTPTAEGDSLLFLGWSLPIARADGRTEALAGFPELLRDGEVVGDLGVSSRPGFAAERHPRTAVAYDRDARVAWLVVVEGRIEESAGMSLPELAELLRTLGVSDALNLDGGGSTAMVVQGRLVSRTSDITGERPVANALALRRDAAFCSLPEPGPVAGPGGSSAPARTPSHVAP